jgi:hypothetical protein
MSSPTTQRRQSTSSACTVCKAQGKANQLLQCVGCSESVHLGCLHKQYKESIGERYSKLDWLADFIKHANLVYRCKACTEMSKTAQPASMATAIESSNVDNKINRMQQSIDELSFKMSSLMASSSLCSCSVTQPTSNPTSTGDTAPATNSAKPTYAQMLSAKDISKAVEAAVAKSLVSHQMLEQQKAAVVMYGMYEYGNDWDDIADIFQLISCQARPLQLTRLGKEGRGNTRPLKIVLSSLTDCKEVLACASKLRRHDTTYQLRLSSWLSEEEMVKVRCERKRCKELNDKATWTNGSKPPFVVISGVLMTRDNDGKLVPFKEPASSIASKPEAATSSSSSAVNTPSTGTDSLAQSKNEKGGSQAAPLQ